MLSTSNLNRISGKKTENKTQVMYSPDGAKFQEWALSMVGTSKAYSADIARLVNQINNGQITVDSAHIEFNTMLWSK